MARISTIAISKNVFKSDDFRTVREALQEKLDELIKQAKDTSKVGDRRMHRGIHPWVSRTWAKLPVRYGNVDTK